MKKFVIFLIFGFMWCLSLGDENSIYYQVKCENLESGYRVCKLWQRIIYVEPIHKKVHSDHLHIKDKNVNRISSDSFGNLEIVSLSLELKDTDLILDRRCFNKLPNLRKLEFLSGIVVLTQNVFTSLKNTLEHLSFAIREASKAEAKGYIHDIFLELPKLVAVEMFNVSLTFYDHSSFGIVPSMTDLIISGGKFLSIKRNSFRVYEKLSRLKISSIQEIHIEDGAFDGANHLTTITITDSHIKTAISNQIFVPVKTLKYLNLENNQFSNFRPGAFSELKNLKMLELKNCSIFSISEDSFLGIITEQMDLSNNQIRYVEKNGFRNATIQNLHLYNNPIKSIDRIESGLGFDTKVHF